MAFFNNDTFTSAIPTIEGAQYDVDFGGAANIAMEAYADQLEIVKAIHAADMAELRCKAQYGGACESYDAAAELDRVMEASGGNIFERIRDLIKNFFAKVGKFFKGLYQRFFQMNMSNKNFSEKYKSVVEELEKDFPSSWKVTNTYPYLEYSKIAEYCETIGEVASKAMDNIRTSVDEKLADLDKYSDENAEDMSRYKDGDLSGLIAVQYEALFKAAGLNAFGGAGDSTTEKMYAYVRNGSKGDISYNVSMLKKELEALGKFDVKAIKKAEDKTSKDFNAILKTINNAEKTYKAMPNDNKNKQYCVKYANNLSSAVTKTKSFVLTFMSVVRTTTNDMAQRTKTATIIGIDEARKAKKNREKREKDKK